MFGTEFSSFCNALISNKYCDGQMPSTASSYGNCCGQITYILSSSLIINCVKCDTQNTGTEYSLLPSRNGSHVICDGQMTSTKQYVFPIPNK